jgi:hypothetical protein
MMIPAVLLILLLVFASGCSTPPRQTTPPAPDSVGARIEAHRTRDLRTLFRSVETIRILEEKQVCLIQGGLPRSNSIERNVGNGLSLKQVIDLIFSNGYDGQVKVVSRDSIVQTPLEDYDPGKQASILVRPGDLVFILGRE